MIDFAYDAKTRFATLQKNYLKKKAAMPDARKTPESVDGLVYDLVHKYVRLRACARAGLEKKADDNEWWKETGWMATAEERRDVASKLFLELRSRRGDDFVRHFTATLGSVPQWLNDVQFLAVAEALMRDHTDETGERRPRTRDDVKTLTLLALAAASRSLRQHSQTDDATTQENSE